MVNFLDRFIAQRNRNPKTLQRKPNGEHKIGYYPGLIDTFHHDHFDLIELLEEQNLYTLYE